MLLTLQDAPMKQDRNIKHGEDKRESAAIVSLIFSIKLPQSNGLGLEPMGLD